MVVSRRILRVRVLRTPKPKLLWSSPRVLTCPSNLPMGTRVVSACILGRTGAILGVFEVTRVVRLN